jgi:RHS repeat-associated protein
MKSLKFSSFILVAAIGIFHQCYAGRMYDSRIARFTTPDPMGQYASPYTYCGNNPLRYVDPTGLWADGAWATVYRVDGKTVHDDGIDNGLVVNTSQKIIDESTVNGTTNWDDVRNNAGSDVQIVDANKYWNWADAQIDALMAASNGAARVSADNRGNFSVSSPMGVGTMMGMMLGPVGISQLVGALLPSAFTLNPNWKNWGQYMAKRGWTVEEINQTISTGVRATHTDVNYLNAGNPMSIITNPQTGKSLIIDNVTKEIIMLGQKGFKY